MIGLILGDIAGSRFEKQAPPVSKAFDLITDKCCFTDDTVLSCAVADSILNNKDYSSTIIGYHDKYPFAGYGRTFKEWAADKGTVRYESFGNGSAMRVAPIGWAFETEKEVLEEAEKTASSSHCHEEGIKGAKAIALAVFLARKGASKKEIKQKIEFLGYREICWMNVDLHDQFDATCQGTVPQAIWSFLMSNSMEDAIRRAIWIGGDADTLAAMAGAISHAYYYRGANLIEQKYVDIVVERIPPELLDIVKTFTIKYIDKEFCSNMEFLKASEKTMKDRHQRYINYKNSSKGVVLENILKKDEKEVDLSPESLIIDL